MKNNNDSIKLEILQYSYWEHYKFEKDISMVLPLEDPKRNHIRQHTQEILEKIKELKQK